jgi:hypothetical protein
MTSLCLFSLPTDFLDGDPRFIRLMLNLLSDKLSSLTDASVFCLKIPVDFESLAISWFGNVSPRAIEKSSPRPTAVTFF